MGSFQSKVLLFFLLGFNLNAYALQRAATVCDKKIGEISDNYAKNGKFITSYSIKNCSTYTTGTSPVVNASGDTGAPEIINSNACVIVISSGNLNDLAVFDTVNDFELVRSFGNREENFNNTTIGNNSSGIIMFFKHEGPSNTTTPDYITRADYNMSNDTVHLAKWNLGWFGNIYSHDYTLQCEK